MVLNYLKLFKVGNVRFFFFIYRELTLEYCINKCFSVTLTEVVEFELFHFLTHIFSCPYLDNSDDMKC